MKQKEKDILGSALKLFVQEGIQGAATADIAKKAGVSNGTLFHYYENKNKLIESLYEHIKRDQVIAILENVNEETSLDDRFHMIWKNWIDWCIEKEKEDIFCCQFENSIFHKKKHEQLDAELKEMFEWMTEKGIQQRKLALMPYEMVYELTRSHVRGMVCYLKANPVKYRTPEFIKQAYVRYESGLAPS